MCPVSPKGQWDHNSIFPRPIISTWLKVWPIYLWPFACLSLIAWLPYWARLSLLFVKLLIKWYVWLRIGIIIILFSRFSQFPNIFYLFVFHLGAMVIFLFLEPTNSAVFFLSQGILAVSSSYLLPDQSHDHYTHIKYYHSFIYKINTQNNNVNK